MRRFSTTGTISASSPLFTVSPMPDASLRTSIRWTVDTITPSLKKSVTPICCWFIPFAVTDCPPAACPQKSTGEQRQESAVNRVARPAVGRLREVSAYVGSSLASAAYEAPYVLASRVGLQAGRVAEGR